MARRTSRAAPLKRTTINQSGGWRRLHPPSPTPSTVPPPSPTRRRLSSPPRDDDRPRGASRSRSSTTARTTRALTARAQGGYLVVGTTAIPNGWRTRTSIPAVGTTPGDASYVHARATLFVGRCRRRRQARSRSRTSRSRRRTGSSASRTAAGSRSSSCPSTSRRATTRPARAAPCATRA